MRVADTYYRRVHLKYRVLWALEPWRFFAIMMRADDDPKKVVFDRRRAAFFLGQGIGAGRVVGSKKRWGQPK